MARRDGEDERGTTTAEEQEQEQEVEVEEEENEEEEEMEDGGTPSQSVASSRGWE